MTPYFPESPERFHRYRVSLWIASHSQNPKCQSRSYNQSIDTALILGPQRVATPQTDLPYATSLHVLVCVIISRTNSKRRPLA
jgi:hypothetical protein